MSGRTVIFGLDGVTFDVIDPLLAAGRMPALASLIARGVRAPLRSTVPPVSAPAWVTFLTGKHPGKHGVFNFQNLDARRYSGFSETLVNSSFFRGTTLLDHVGAAAGLRQLAYRVPMTFPAWDLPNGIIVSGPPVPDRRRAYARPVAVETELGTVSPLTHDELNAAKRNCDVDAVDACNRFELDLLERVARDHLGRGTELMVLFTGILDGLHHNFWAFHDPSSPLHERDAPANVRTLITRWYVEIDAAIGRVLAGLDDDTAVMVISDHGGGPAPTRHLNLNAFLHERGDLVGAGQRRARVASRIRRLVDRAREQLPARVWLKRHLSERALGRLRGLRNATAAIAWEQTRAYAMPIYYPITGVWVNLRGRQAKGTVAPGSEYETLRDELAVALRELRDPATGAPLLVGVWRREDVYQGPHTADAPDLIVQTTPGVHGGFDFDQLMTEVPAATLRVVSGSHTQEGIFVAAGGPFRRGVTIASPSLADVLPTAVHLLGGDLPDDLDGRVIDDALDPAWVAAHPVRTGEHRAGRDGREALSQDDEAEMRKFLQGLGYVE